MSEEHVKLGELNNDLGIRTVGMEESVGMWYFSICNCIYKEK